MKEYEAKYKEYVDAKRVQDRIVEEQRQELIKPYMSIFKGQKVPRSSLDPIFDVALDLGISEGRFSQESVGEEVVIFLSTEGRERYL